jgi:hypothetical protein
MWRFASKLVVVAFAVAGGAGAQERAVTYYIQLIRSSDSEQPPQAESRRVGTKLAGTFCGVLKWKDYWEICQRKAEVIPGRATMVWLSNGREVEIDLSRRGKRTVTAFQNGRLVDRTIVPAGEAMTLIGGDRDQKSAWFIVVRRDKPGG